MIDRKKARGRIPLFSRSVFPVWTCSQAGGGEHPYTKSGVNDLRILKFVLKNWKRCVAFAAVFAFASGIYMTYNQYFTEQQILSFVYSNAEKGRYPDGSRFEIYDLLSDEMLALTLEKLNQDGKFQNRTVGELRACFSIQAHLSAPVQAKVQAARKNGENYSYIPTEYVVTASTGKNFGFFNLRNLFAANTAKELLNALTETYYQYFLDKHTENNVLEKVSQDSDYSQYDYPEIADSIESNINLYLQYLQSKKAEDATFRSSATGKSFQDLISSFENLLSIRANTYKSYVYASKISKDKEALISVYEAQVEDLQLKANKKAAEAEIAGKAMEEYDHTFEESIVITGVDKKNDEVYQVKPKTGYDFVTKQSLDAGVDASAFQEEINDKRRRIEEYRKVSLSPDEAARIAAVSDSMVAEITKEQASLQQITQQTVADYLKRKNSDYVKIKPIAKQYLSAGFLIKVCAAAFAGILAALLYAVLLWLKKRYLEHGEQEETKKTKKTKRTKRTEESASRPKKGFAKRASRKKAKEPKQAKASQKAEKRKRKQAEKAGKQKQPAMKSKKRKIQKKDVQLYDAMRELENQLSGIPNPLSARKKQNSDNPSDSETEK